MTNAYPDYKPSGIDWLGDIPAHWEVKKLKYIGKVFNGSTPNSGTSEYWDGDITWVTPADIGKLSNKYIQSSIRTITSNGLTSCGITLLPENSIIITTRAPIGNVAVAGTELCTNQGCKSLVTHSSVPVFLYYQFIGIKIILDSLGSGTTFKELSIDTLKSFALPIPPLAEQIAIAEYLDKQTAQLDGLVAQKRELISLLQEERAGIINDAVTQGLNHRIPRKESGLPWLGKIPAHWEVKKLKYVARLRSGDSITADSIRDEGNFPVYGGNGLRGYTTSFTHEGNYVIIGRQGALCGNINYAEGKFWASEHAVVVTIQSGDQYRWLGKILETMNLNQYSVSAAQPGLAIERVKELYLPVPPVEEQAEIVAHLDSETARIDETIQTIEEEINLLTEYRSALISEVVTGKQKVS